MTYKVELPHRKPTDLGGFITTAAVTAVIVGGLFALLGGDCSGRKSQAQLQPVASPVQPTKVEKPKPRKPDIWQTHVMKRVSSAKDTVGTPLETEDGYQIWFYGIYEDESGRVRFDKGFHLEGRAVPYIGFSEAGDVWRVNYLMTLRDGYIAKSVDVLSGPGVEKLKQHLSSSASPSRTDEKRAAPRDVTARVVAVYTDEELVELETADGKKYRLHADGKPFKFNYSVYALPSRGFYHRGKKLDTYQAVVGDEWELQEATMDGGRITAARVLVVAGKGIPGWIEPIQ